MNKLNELIEWMERNNDVFAIPEAGYYILKAKAEELQADGRNSSKYLRQAPDKWAVVDKHDILYTKEEAVEIFNEHPTQLQKYYTVVKIIEL